MPSPNKTSPPGRRSGFTLLELLLALLISGVILGALGMLIDLQLRTVDSTRAEVEQAHQARALLRLIADDLRSAVRYAPQDTSGISGSAAASAAAAAAVSGDDPSALSASAGDALGIGSLGTDTADTTSEDAASAEESLEPPPIPGLYGSNFDLQVDVSRLPRIDQYQSMMMADSQQLPLADVVSDVKTVAYYLTQSAVTAGAGTSNPGSGPVGAAGMNSPTALPASGATAAYGLARRQLDRAATQYAAEQGALASLNQSAVVVSQSVVGLYFRYFDGTQWALEWDSTVSNGLPLAVEITLILAPAGEESQGPQSMLDYSSGQANPLTYPAYHLIVRLPAAEPTSTTDPTTTEETDDDSTDSSSSSSSSPSSSSPSSSSSSSGS